MPALRAARHAHDGTGRHADPHNRALQDLVGELSTRSDTFRTLWGAHNVRTHGAGTKRFRHPIVGELTLVYEEFAITADPGTRMLIYTAEPGSASAERLVLLASWEAEHPVQAATTSGRGPATDAKPPRVRVILDTCESH